jgi:NAD(P)-dependent dehydrogenase (short-subunit alcohol dehydrogenase family)
MSGRFAGGSVLVTGAARGLGRRAAEMFCAEGARLVVSDLTQESAEATAQALRAAGGEAIALAGDVADEATAERLVAAALEAYGRLDVAVNNAGVAHPFVKLAATATETMRTMMAVNAMGVFFALKAQIPVMERQGGGAILNVASVAGIVGAPMLAAYAASKHAVIGLTKSAAGEAARKGVRINAICPSFAATDMVGGMVGAMQGGEAAAVERIVSHLPMRRLASVEEVAQAMLFACAPENSFMTGHALVIDGGLSAV